jgi:hypothetical protein
MTHFNGSFHDPIGAARDGYENSVGDGRNWIRDKSHEARVGFTLVCRECRKPSLSCDCPRGVASRTPLVNGDAA